MSVQGSRVQTPAVSKSRSRIRPSRQPSVSSALYLPDGPTDLLLPDGQVGEEAVELLYEFVHPHQHDAERTLIEAEDEGPGDDEDSTGEIEWETRKQLPWWKRPSPLWFLCLLPFSAITMAATLAPRIEIYTQLACKVHKPEYTDARGPAEVGIYMPSAGFAQTSRPLPDNFSPFLNDSNSDNVTFDEPIHRGLSPEVYKKQQSLCASDPVVQAAVAQLSTVTTATMGVLGFVTTAWWGSLSDRYGRVKIMKFTVFGLLFSALNFIVTALYYQYLPGGYWFFVLGSFVDGIFGGITTGAAAIHAYMADCTEPSSRSRMFSLQLGLLFAGIAFGPTVGGLIVRVTENLLSVFYIALAIDIFYASIVWFVIPESLTSGQMALARRRYQEELVREQAARDGGPAPGLLVRFRRLFKFLSPLSIFLPPRVDQGVSPFKGRKRDWNLTLAAVGFGIVTMIMGGISFKFQYAAARYNWGSESMGYWLTLVGATRAFHLTVMLPVAIHFFKSKPQAIQLPLETEEPLMSSSSAEPSKPAAARVKHLGSPALDLGIARFSLFVEIVIYIAMPLAPTGVIFTCYAMVGSLGSGFGPALQSLALELYSRQGGTESGRLFGALSVIQTLSSQVIGPAVFGVTYMKTVKTFPQAIFFLSSASVFVSFILLSFIRFPKENRGSNESDVEGLANSEGMVREDTLVNVEDYEASINSTEARGRKMKSSATAA